MIGIDAVVGHKEPPPGGLVRVLVGLLDGLDEGLFDGFLVGIVVGTLDGRTELGLVDGRNVEGRPDGAVNFTEGAELVGFTVDTMVGFEVGASVEGAEVVDIILTGTTMLTLAVALGLPLSDFLMVGAWDGSAVL